MKNILLAVSIGCLALCSSCNTPNEQSKAAGKDSAIGRVEIYDSNATAIIDSNAVIEVIGKNYKWSELNLQSPRDPSSVGFAATFSRKGRRNATRPLSWTSPAAH